MNLIESANYWLDEDFQINEAGAGLSRAYSHMQNYDSGIITAFRYAKMCGGGPVYPKSENMKRNADLLKDLKSLGYGVISVKGSYIENYGSDNEHEVGENSFFVFNLKDNDLLQDLKTLGKKYEQDSILYIPKGGNSAELHGTNDCPERYPAGDEIVKFDTRGLGSAGEFFTKLNGKPFVFK
jgi:hypothetical protein